MKKLWEPKLIHVLDAKKRISRYIHKTPIIYNRKLSQILEAKIFIECENNQVTGAFKVRGGLNLISHLTDDEKKKGVIAVSTGNHGQSVAYASDKYGVDATIVMPEKSNPYKVEAIKSWGAKIIFHGRDNDEARIWTEQQVKKRGLRYIHSGDEPFLIAGVGTMYLEILEEIPDTEIIIALIGGGSGASGACIVAKNINKNIRIVGAQSEGAPAVYYS